MKRTPSPGAGGIAILILVAIAIVAPACAADEGPEDVANDVSTQIMSPFCPGVTLHECPSQQARDLRERIVVWAEAGWSEERILATVEAEYGPQIRAVPPTGGSGLLAWILPALAVVVGGVFAWFLARRWSKRRRLDAPRPSPSEEERRRVDAELARVRGVGP